MSYHMYYFQWKGLSLRTQMTIRQERSSQHRLCGRSWRPPRPLGSESRRLESLAQFYASQASFLRSMTWSGDGRTQAAWPAYTHWDDLTKQWYIWLVVWNIVYFSMYEGNVIIPIDELVFFRSVETTNQYNTSLLSITFIHHLRSQPAWPGPKSSTAAPICPTDGPNGDERPLSPLGLTALLPAEIGTPFGALLPGSTEPTLEDRC